MGQCSGQLAGVSTLDSFLNNLLARPGDPPSLTNDFTFFFVQSKHQLRELTSPLVNMRRQEVVMARWPISGSFLVK